MKSNTDQREQFEIVYDPDFGTTFIYRYLHAGVCTPFTPSVPVCDRHGAEAEALRHGLMRSSSWTSTASGFDYATAHKVDTDFA